jgi:hypothetical protein
MGALPVVYKYQQDGVDYDVSFLFEKGHHMINATEMAKPFGKAMSHFLDDPSRYNIVIKLCLRNTLNINDNDIPSSLSISELASLFPESIVVVKGGLNIHSQGTWFHEDIAIEFARWLSSDFAIWCNDKIKELLRYSSTFLITTERNEINEHIDHQVQRENSKAIGKKGYSINKDRNKVIRHFKDIMHKYCGLYPYQIVAWARRNNVPSTIINGGSREVLRFIESSAPACISLIENCIACSADKTIDDVDELIPIVKGLEPFFDQLYELGYGNPEDIKKIKKYKQLMQKRGNQLALKGKK